MKFRPIAIHLPQFHPFEENNKWWGEGFTEWTNVKKATARFENHYQPHVPHQQIGQYDLRDQEVRKNQTQLAKQYGLEGFCYYHYWFNGKRLMHEAIDKILEENNNDFPFMFCWANENWSRRWDGSESEILIAQEYAIEDDIKHINWLIEHVFSKPSYIKIDEKPVLLLYKYHFLPDCKKTIEIWRKEVKKAGYKDLYICGTQALGNQYLEPENHGFDASVEFQPDWQVFNNQIPRWKKLFLKLGVQLKHDFIYEYDTIVKAALTKPKPIFKEYPCVCPSWDNSSRRKNLATILINATPKKYGHWLKKILEKFEPYSKDENLVFINAWNEWAEGNHLEPDQKWNFEYLQETKKAIDTCQK
jgi:lipopolysaccharide biosynthesis protein